MIIHLEDILKTSWKGLEDVFKTSFQDVLKTFRRRFDNVLAKHRGDIFLRRKQKTSSTGLHQDLLKRARCPPWTKDVNWTYIRQMSRASSERLICIQFTSFVQGIRTRGGLVRGTRTIYCLTTCGRPICDRLEREVWTRCGKCKRNDHYDKSSRGSDSSNAEEEDSVNQGSVTSDNSNLPGDNPSSANDKSSKSRLWCNR